METRWEVDGRSRYGLCAVIHQITNNQVVLLDLSDPAIVSIVVESVVSNLVRDHIKRDFSICLIGR